MSTENKDFGFQNNKKQKPQIFQTFQPWIYPEKMRSSENKTLVTTVEIFTS